MSGYLQEREGAVRRKAVTVQSLSAMRAAGEKIATLTCYDASFASLMDYCGVDLLLVGDSLGNVLQGHGTTLPVTIADNGLQGWRSSTSPAPAPSIGN